MGSPPPPSAGNQERKSSKSRSSAICRDRDVDSHLGRTRHPFVGLHAPVEHRHTRTTLRSSQKKHFPPAVRYKVCESLSTGMNMTVPDPILSVQQWKPSWICTSIEFHTGRICHIGSRVTTTSLESVKVAKGQIDLQVRR